MELELKGTMSAEEVIDLIKDRAEREMNHEVDKVDFVFVDEIFTRVDVVFGKKIKPTSFTR